MSASRRTPRGGEGDAAAGRRPRWGGSLGLGLAVGGAVVLLVAFGSEIFAQREVSRQTAHLHSLARKVAAAVDPEAVSRLTGLGSDERSRTYAQMKRQLRLLRQEMEDVRFLYLTRWVRGRVVFLVDSEMPGSKDESPPGQVYVEAAPGHARVAASGGVSVEGPFEDRWGTWMSASVPIVAPGRKEVVGVMGVYADAGRLAKAVVSERLKGGTLGLLVAWALLLGLAYRRQFRRALDRAQGEGDLPLLVRFGPVLVVLGAGLALTTVAVVEIRQRAREQFASEFAQEASSRAELMSAALKRSIGRLERLAEDLNGRCADDRARFGRHHRLVFGEDPTLQAVEWIPRVRRAERAAVEARARKEGLDGFIFKERDPEGKIVPAREREEYFPVLWVEPLAGNEQALGYDLASSPARRQALDRARDTGDAVATEPVRLVQEKEEQLGFLVFAPVYGPGEAPRDQAERARRLQGFVLGVYRYGAYVQRALVHLPPSGVEVSLEDMGAPDGCRVVYRPGPYLWPGEWERGMRHAHFSRRMDLAGRSWRISMVPGRAFLEERLGWESWLAMAGGLLLTGALAFALHHMASSRARLERVRLAGEKRYRLLAENISDVIWVMDAETRRFLYVSPSVQGARGFSAAEVMSQRMEDALTPASLARVEEVLPQRLAEFQRGESRAYRDEFEQWRKDGSTVWIETVTHFQRRSEDGGVEVLGVGRDITARRRADEALRRSLAYEKVLSEISASAAQAEDQREFEERCVAVMGQAVGVSRAYIFENREATDTMDNTVEWCAAGVSAQKENLQGVPNAIAPWWLGELRGGRTVGFEDVEAVADEEVRKTLRAQGILSILAVPLFVDGKFHGFLGFDECVKRRAWPKEDVEMLRGISRILSGAIERARARAALREAHAGMERRVEERTRELRQEVGVRERAEAALRERNSVLSSLLDSIPDLVFFKDLEGRYLGCNPPFLRFAGRAREEVLGRTDAELFPAESARAFREDDLRVMRAGNIERFQERITYPDGTPAVVETAKCPLRDAEGRVIGVLGISRDVTERERTAVVLRESEERWRFALDGAGDGLWDWDIATRKVHYSSRWKSMLGYAEGEVGDDEEEWSGRIHPEDRARVLGEVEAYFAGRKPEYMFEHRLRCRDGSYRWVLSRGKVVSRRPDGRPLRVIGTHTDIDPQRRAEQRLQESEARFRGMFDRHSAVMLLVDPGSGAILDANRSAEAFYGHPRAKLCAMLIEEINVLGRDQVAAERAKAATRSENRFVFPHRLADGRIRWVEVFSTPIAAGGKTVLFSIIHDITERRNAEELVRVSREKLALALEGSGAGLWDWRVQTGEATFDEGWARIVGRTLEELGPTSIKTWERLCHPEDLRRSAELMQRHFRGESPLYECEARMRHKDGRWVWVLDRGKVTEWGEGGLPVRMTGTHLDITARKRGEEELRKLWNAVESSPVSVMITNAEGAIEHVNPWFTRQTGYGLDEVVGKTPRILKSGAHPPGFYEEMWRALLDGETWRGEICNRRKDGVLYWESLVISPVRDAGGRITHYVAVRENVTERKRIADELLRAKEAADEASRAKSAFLANMSHEIRTPMNVILGNAQLLRRDPTLGEEARTKLEVINRSGEHLLALLNQVLEISKVEAGRATLAAAEFDLRALLDEVVALFRLRLEDGPVRLAARVSSGVPRRAVADEGKLRQILVNLLGNAAKFTKRGKIAVRAASVGEKGGGARLAIEVEDTGIGIAEPDLRRLFRPFEQAEGGRRIQAGTGLGLAISREYARLMGGDLTVESAPGRGSVFRLEVPVRVGSAGAGAERGSAHGFRIGKGQKAARVLVVDDQADNRGWLRELLEAAGFEVREAGDGEAGVKAWQEWPAELVLMDLRMPRMDGIEATRQIRRLDSAHRSRVFMLTAAVFEVDRDALAKAGVAEVVSKPVSEEDLFEKIRVHLGLRYAPKATAALKGGKGHAGTVPAPLRKALLEALREGDSQALVRISREVERSAPELGRILRAMADNYDYDGMARLLKGKGLA